MPTTSRIAPAAIRSRGQRLPSLAETIEAISTPSGNGTVVRPDCKGDRPKPVCRNTASTRKKPATPEKKVRVMTVPSTKLPLRIRLTGSNSLLPAASRRFS